jgi:inward rectifier potassium channel
VIRLGNERGNRVVEADVHVDLSRRIVNKEGVVFYRMFELKLVRDRIGALARSFSVLHVIDENSPLFGITPKQFDEEEVELFVSVTGLDDTSGQTMHGQVVYEGSQIVFGARHADVLSLHENGNMVMDTHKFDELIATEPTSSFPYPPPPM